MTNSRASRQVANSIQNVLDYLMAAELLLDSNSVAESTTRVSWHARNPQAGFWDVGQHINSKQYLSWLLAGHYSCILFDGSLLQMTYHMDGDQVVKHRLAYVPCPWDIDRSLLDTGLSLEEVLELHESSPIAMRSAVRFDLDFEAATASHPASHLTFNSVDCRIACTAPLHPLRFSTFVFKNFYSVHWRQHTGFFDEALYRHLGDPIILPNTHDDIHIAWNARLRTTS